MRCSSLVSPSRVHSVRCASLDCAPLLRWYGGQEAVASPCAGFPCLIYSGLVVLCVFRLIVAGSRSFSDYGRLAADLDRLLVNRLPSVEIVCGGCPSGADALAARYASERGLPLRVFPADWSSFGRSAGPLRNRAMAEYGEALVVYWNGVSPGTASMIRCASSCGLRVVVRRF